MCIIKYVWTNIDKNLVIQSTFVRNDLKALHQICHCTKISVPKVRIFGDRDIFVKSSSTVQLKCVVSQSLVAPTYMEWRHNKERIPITATVGAQNSG